MDFIGQVLLNTFGMCLGFSLAYCWNHIAKQFGVTVNQRSVLLILIGAIFLVWSRDLPGWMIPILVSVTGIAMVLVERMQKSGRSQ